MDGQFLLTVFLMLLGSGIFLRIVAKEKRRRERYLELRVMQQNQPVKELKQRVAAEATQEPIVIATPADLRGGGSSDV